MLWSSPFLPSFPIIQSSQHASPPSLNGYRPLKSLPMKLEDKRLRIPTQLSKEAPHSLYFPSLEVLQCFKSQGQKPWLLGQARNPEIFNTLGRSQVSSKGLIPPRKATSSQCLGPWKQGAGSTGPIERAGNESEGAASDPLLTPGAKCFSLGPTSGLFQGIAVSSWVPQWVLV